MEKNSLENGSKQNTTGENVHFFNEIKTNEETESGGNETKDNKNKRECEAKVIWKCADFVAFNEKLYLQKNIVCVSITHLQKSVSRHPIKFRMAAHRQSYCVFVIVSN